MREKLAAIVFALIILSASLPIVASTQSIKSVTPEATLQTGKPDLVGKVEVIKQNGRYYFKHTITNNGTATAEKWRINVTLYNFGGLFMKKIGFDPYNPIHAFIAYILIWKANIWLIPVLGQSSQGTNVTYALEPNESYSWNGFALPNQDSINAQIGLVVECIVDEYNWVNESNENNNYMVYRWWRPYETDPPF